MSKTLRICAQPACRSVHDLRLVLDAVELRLHVSGAVVT